jgi:chemotaxis protein methyltransferase CheR
MSVTAADFDYVRRLVADDCALALADGKEYLVQTRLAPLAQREGLGSVTELIGVVRGGAADLRRQVVEALATHETQFFRDVHPFDAIRDTVIPELLRDTGGRRLAIWSAASSSGQEPYSLALLIREHYPNLADLTLLATDLSEQVLARARTGRFSQLEVGRGLPVQLLVKYFDQRDRNWQLKDEVRRLVSFRQLNLAKPFGGLPTMDLVLLRNVLIYFDGRAREALLDRVSRVLRPGGYLCLGATELLSRQAGGYDRVQIGRSMFYRRTGVRGVV